MTLLNDFGFKFLLKLKVKGNNNEEEEEEEERRKKTQSHEKTRIKAIIISFSLSNPREKVFMK